MRTVLLAALLVTARAAAQQPNPEDQARSLLEDGRNYYAQRKYKQALDSFNLIITGYANTASVGDALLELGRYQSEVDGDFEKARQSFDSVTKRFPQSDSAAGALYHLGMLTLDRAQTAAELEDALAQFTRVQRLYPKSDWVPRALNATGLVHRKAGRLPEAVDVQRRVWLEYPTSDAAVTAQFQVGHCLALLGEARPAMEAFQQVRNRFPDSEWSARAVERITAIYRLSEGKRPLFSVDSAFSAGAGDVLKDVRSLLITPARTLWIASDKVKSAVPFDRDGKMGSGVPAEDLKGLSLTPRGDVMVVSRLAIRLGARDVKSFTVPGTKPGETEALDKIAAALVLPAGDLLIADEKKKHVYRFGANLEYRGMFPDTKERSVIRMALDGEGGVALLDGDEKGVRVFDETGKALRAVAAKGQGYELKKPLDVALDAARNLYVADEEMGVLVLAPDGHLLTSIPPDEVRKARALALEPAGAILVYDDKTQRVLRFK